MVSLSSSMCRCPCHHRDGVVALAMMALLPLMCWHLCCHCDGNCCYHWDGVSAIVKLAQSSSWCCCPHNNGVVPIINMQACLLSSSWCCCPCCNGVPSLMCRRLCSPGVFAIATIIMLPLSQWHCCPCQAGIVALVTMALSPSSMCRCFCHCHYGVVAIIALAPSPKLHGHCCPCCACIVVLIALTFSPSCCMDVITIVAPALLPPLSWHVSTIALVLSHLSH
jgi:hypothetical protein